jgi:hypothetical protein
MINILRKVFRLNLKKIISYLDKTSMRLWIIKCDHQAYAEIDEVNLNKFLVWRVKVMSRLLDKLIKILKKLKQS